MKYYLQIVKDNVSILVDSDVGYYHQFKIDDIIEILMDNDLGVSLNINGWVIQNPKFTIDWDKRVHQELSIASAVMNVYMIDVTKQVNRQSKLEELGI